MRRNRIRAAAPETKPVRRIRLVVNLQHTSLPRQGPRPSFHSRQPAAPAEAGKLVPPTPEGPFGKTTRCTRLVLSAVDPGDPEHVGGAGGANRNTGGDDDPLTGFGNFFSMGDPHRLLHHIAKALDIAGVHAMDPP